MVKGFRDHKLHNVLVDPGLADLTADVDFGALSRASQGEGIYTYTHTVNALCVCVCICVCVCVCVGAGCAGPITQNEFLHKMGIRQRMQVSHRTLHLLCILLHSHRLSWRRPATLTPSDC